MGREEWIDVIIYFQAWCRGYLLRTELKCVQVQYEDIVKELEGRVEHLSWRGQVIPKPHFTDADKDDAFLSYPRPKIQTQACPEAVEEAEVPDETPSLHSEDLVPERDCRETSTPPEGDTEREGVQMDSVAETAAQALQMSNSILQQAPPMRTLLKDVAHTPEALKQHRNTLAMELLWIQQAIASRKKYLTLKQKMDAS